MSINATHIYIVQLLYNATIENINVNNFDSKKKKRVLHLKEIGFLDNDPLRVCFCLVTVDR